MQLNQTTMKNNKRPLAVDRLNKTICPTSINHYKHGFKGRKEYDRLSLFKRKKQNELNDDNN